jgi:hypothetical protein
MNTLNADRRRRRGSKAKVKPEIKHPKPEKIRYMTGPSYRPEVLAKYGRRVAKFIADSPKGRALTASVAYCHITTSELESMHEAGVIKGGFDKFGARDSSLVICNV